MRTLEGRLELSTQPVGSERLARFSKGVRGEGLAKVRVVSCAFVVCPCSTMISDSTDNLLKFKIFY